MRVITHVRAGTLTRLSPLAPISLPLSQLSARRAPPLNLRVPRLVEDLEPGGQSGKDMEGTKGDPEEGRTEVLERGESTSPRRESWD